MQSILRNDYIQNLLRALGHAAMVVATDNFEKDKTNQYENALATKTEADLKIVRKDEGPRILVRLSGVSPVSASKNHNLIDFLQKDHQIIKNGARTVSVAVYQIPLKSSVRLFIVDFFYAFIPKSYMAFFHLNLGSHGTLSNIRIE